MALADSDDKHHADAVAIQHNLVTAHARLYTTNFLVDETYTLILARLGYRFAVQFLTDDRDGTITIVRIAAADEQRAEQILRQYDRADSQRNGDEAEGRRWLDSSVREGRAKPAVTAI
ncbi:MAG TPA: hypothetical protein VIO16_15275, partial [Dehalococcoidia bacterium]